MLCPYGDWVIGGYLNTLVERLTEGRKRFDFLMVKEKAAMSDGLRKRWTVYRRRREVRQLRENLAYFGYSLSEYSDAQLLARVDETPQIARASCTTDAEAAYIFRQLEAGAETGDGDGGR